MSGIDIALKIGGVVSGTVVKQWLAARKTNQRQKQSLNELVDEQVLDVVRRRDFLRKVEQISDGVAKRMLPFCETELPDLTANERDAALDSIVGAFKAINFSDAGLFTSNLDRRAIGERIQRELADIETVSLSPAAERFRRVAVDEVAASIMQMITHLPETASRLGPEILQRFAVQADKLDAALERMPMRRLDAPDGEAHDDEFRLRYFEYISKALDSLDLFGIDTRNYSPQTTLSVAYISLSVDARRKLGAVEPGVHEPRQGATPSYGRVEDALAATDRTLIRGEAGSGKSTLLRWLAIMAVRGTFPENMRSWNGLVPFVIKLRSYADERLPRPEEFLSGVADPLIEILPAAWVHRQLKSGRALLLIDGVDELPPVQRAQVRKWLQSLLTAYADIRVVITSRPGAAGRNWLEQEKFLTAMLQRMTPTDVRALIRHWHMAIENSGYLPCPVEELPKFESALIARLDANPHLRTLATSPLLCSMLCALNLDKETQLPRNRLGLYRDAIELLVDKRDSERQIPSANINIEQRVKIRLLQRLAYWLSSNSRAEMPSTVAREIVSASLSAMPNGSPPSEQVLRFLVDRSGVLREPAINRIDFVHKTFQDYLAAAEAAEQSAVGVLVNNAHLDSWRDVVIMAAGLGNTWVKEELFRGLMERVRAGSRHSRTIKLLVVSCLETVAVLEPPELLRDIEKMSQELIPPRSSIEARSLATVGDRILDFFPPDLSLYSEIQAGATTQTCAFVNGERAMQLLSTYMTDPRRAVRQWITSHWQYFDTSEFARRVLSAGKLDDLVLRVSSVGQLKILPHLSHVNRVTIDFSHHVRTGSFEFLDSIRGVNLTGLRVRAESGIVPASLKEFSNLRSLTLYFRSLKGRISDLGVLGSLEGLTVAGYDFTSIRFLERLRNLGQLSLSSCSRVKDYLVLSELPKLVYVSIYGTTGFDFDLLSPRELLSLSLGFLSRPRGDLDSVIRSSPGLRFLNLHTDEKDSVVIDAMSIVGLSHLVSFSLRGKVKVLNVEALRQINPGIEDIAVGAVPTLEIFRNLKRLSYVELSDPPATLDVAPMADTAYSLYLGRKCQLKNLSAEVERRIHVLG